MVLGSVISIHAPRVGSDHTYIRYPALPRISIHAPRVGSDRRFPSQRRYNSDFNPRSPCGERLYTSPGSVIGLRFQSTLPVWGATRFVLLNLKKMLFQSTLPVWGATGGQTIRPAGDRISIHAPRVGSDRKDSQKRVHLWQK